MGDRFSEPDLVNLIELFDHVPLVIIGGIGSIRGAFLAAILVGLIDTIGRAFLPDMLRLILSRNAAETLAPALSSMSARCT